MSKEKTYKKSLYFITHGAILAILLVVVLLATTLTAKWDSALTDFFGTVGGTKTSAQAGDFLSDYESEEAVREAQLAFTKQVAGEGAVLLKNEGAMPLKEGASVSVFGIASKSTTSEGEGSGDIAIDSDTLAQSLEKAGFKVNPVLTQFTASSKHAHGTGSGPGNGTAMGEWKIDEIPQSEYTDEVKASYGEYGDAAIVIFTRQNGEGSDLPRDVSRFGNAEGRHYLELSVEEEDLLRAIQESGAFSSTIVVVNAANPMELGFLDQEEYGVDACLWHAGLGTEGIESLTGIFAGTVNPSGRLVDTYAYDNLSSPVMQNFGDFRYVDESGNPTGNSYMNYAEGIYVGYRYYETRYEDVVMGTENVGTYDYASTVQFPFGFGLSYTDFAWSGYEVALKEDLVTASVEVENTGSVPGKDVVEIYVQTPYTTGGTEKASVVLAGYAKTGELEPGKKEKVEVTFRLSDIASYDFMENKTWILDEGTYYVAAGKNAHDALNNILAAKGYTEAEGMIGAGNKDLAGSFEQESLTLLDTAVTGEKVTNQFDQDVLADAVYLSRSNWVAMEENGLRYSTQEIPGLSNTTDPEGTVGSVVASGEIKASFTNGGPDSVNIDELLAQDFPAKEDYIYGEEAENPVTLAQLKGAAYDDPRWEQLLNQTKLSEQHILFNNSGYGTKAIEAIEKPKTFEYDGPAGISNFITGKSGFGFPNTIMLAAAWDQDLASQYGSLIGEDALLTKTSGWYAPATNIHRSPFSGRNYEYFSEDPFLSGRVTTNITKTVQDKGVYVYMKHYALNDQESNRSGNGRVAIWSQEQAIREIYLKPFQMAVEEGHAKGIMLSLNRIGTTWAGNHYGLLTKVTRGEWGFEGLFLTDYMAQMDPGVSDKYLAAGGNLILSTNEVKLADVKANWCRAYLRENTHKVLYIQANSLAMNGLGEDVKFEVGTPIYKIALMVIQALFALYALYSLFMMVRYGKMSAQEFSDSRLRTRKARRVKNIIVVIAILALVITFFLVYFPTLQKAFLM